MKCLKCGSKNIEVRVNVNLVIAPEDVFKLTKQAIRKKSTELWGVDWDKAQIICKDCFYIQVGC